MTALAEVAEVPGDAELARRMRDGDNDAFAALYERYAPPVHDFLARLLHDPTAAEDLTQNTFVQVLERRGSLREPERVRSWLYSIAYHLALRQAERARRSAPLDTALDLPVDEPGPEEAALAALAASLVWEAAAGLDARQYTVLDLTVRRGAPTAEVADVLGVPVSHAAVLVHRARDALGGAVRDLLVARAARSCPQLQRLVAEQPEEFTPERRRSVDHHLRVCPQCQQLAARLTAPAELFGSLPLLPLPATLSAGGAAATLARAAQPVSRLSRLWRAVRQDVRLHPAVAGAAVAVALVAGAMLIGGLHAGSPPRARAVAATRPPATSVAVGLAAASVTPIPPSALGIAGTPTAPARRAVAATPRATPARPRPTPRIQSPTPTTPPRATVVPARRTPTPLPKPTATRVPQATPTPTPEPTPARPPEPTPTLAPTTVPTPTPEPPPTPTPTPEPPPTPTPTPEATPTPAPEPSPTPVPLTYSCVWQSRLVTLTHVPNVTVEALPDATLIGTCQDFQTSDSRYAALDGEAINVWTAPKEYPGQDVVHNGGQGSQPVYGTWTFPS